MNQNRIIITESKVHTQNLTTTNELGEQRQTTVEVSIPLDNFHSKIPRFIPALLNNDGTRNVLYDKQFIPTYGSRVVSKLPTAQERSQCATVARIPDLRKIIQLKPLTKEDDSTQHRANL